MDTETAPIDERLTNDEAIALTAGADFWRTGAVPEKGIPALVMADGPHGLRKQTAEADALGVAASEPATCFPPAVALGSTWNVELVERVGQALGREAAAAGVGLLLGPGIDVKRSPLCGRNFEYFAEDPLLSGELGGALVRGIQSQGVGATLKHFVGNTQETDRGAVDSAIGERALREVYLAPFERIVTRDAPAAVMTSYNKLNGVYASENAWLIRTVLRGEWGFDAVVVSDWGAVHDPAAALTAGLDLRMPGPADDEAVRVALADGKLDAATVHTAAGRVARLARHVDAEAPAPTVAEQERHHALAAEAAAEAIVLLKNDGGILPLPADEPLAIIGELARHPRIQNGGSSRVVPTRVSCVLDEIQLLLGGEAPLPFAAGYGLEPDADRAAAAETAERLRDEAVRLASRVRTVVLFLGLPESAESEGFDRSDILLPADHRALLRAIRAVTERIVVVLSHGGVVSVQEIDRSAAAVLDATLLGQGGATAVARTLFGRANPSGHLAETIPVRLEDTPSFLGFPGADGVSEHGEGVFVGYRHYNTTGLEVAYPFGHGLSYTSFAYSALVVDAEDGGDVHVGVTVTNTGEVAGSAVPQLYVSPPPGAVRRPVQELRGFAKVHLAPGESKSIRLRLRERDFAYWSSSARGWRVPPGRYELLIGSSSRQIEARAVYEHPGNGVPAHLTTASTIAEWLHDPRGRRALGAAAVRLDALVQREPDRRDAPISVAVAADRQLAPEELEEAIRRHARLSTREADEQPQEEDS